MGAKANGRRRVLVVNDTQEILELFQEILDELGFESVLMSYAPRELERIRDVAPDLIILDFLFGERQLLGWQLLQKLKMDRSLDHIPVIVCTAAVHEVTQQQGYLTEQNVLVVLKPFNVTQLEEAVNQAFEPRLTARAIERERDGKGRAAKSGSSEKPRGSRTA